MVNNFTADEIGDILFARLVEPYQNVTGINSWSVLVGLSNPNTVGGLTMVGGTNSVFGVNTNLSLQSGDKFIVINHVLTVDTVISPTEFTIVEPAPFTVENIEFYLTPDPNNQFEMEFRWSQNPLDSDGGQMSELRPLNIGAGPRDILGLTFDGTKPLWIDLKFTVDRLSSLSSLTLISTEFEVEQVDGTIESCPQFCTDCVDPYLANGCANIVAECTDAMWNPYNLTKPSKIYSQISDISTEMWGHTVKYFRVEPDKRSSDVILMEYSLYNVKEQGEFKIMVPDNAMPEQTFQYDIFGMGFEDFEIHITKTQFESAFGPNLSPISRDYLYFPLMNRMYEVSSVAFADEFNMDMTYWRVLLKKYEERTSTLFNSGDPSNDAVLESELDDLTTGIEEVFGEEIQKEYQQTSKPEQYQTVFTPVGDGIRDRIHNQLLISDKQIRNKWTIISKNHYDLSTIKDLGIEALVYKRASKLSTNENLATTLWFRPNFTSNTGQQTLITGRVGNEGLEISTNQTEIKIKVNSDVQSYNFDSPLENGTWYGLVFNLNNKYGSMTTDLYRLDPMNNWQTANSTQETITNVFSQTHDYSLPYNWNTTKQWSLMPGKLEMTNIRLFSKTIESEQHINILQQYVVRDNHLAKIIDNAVPSIQLRRYNQNR